MRLVLTAVTALAGIVLGVIAYRLQHEDLHQTVLRSVPAVAIGWTAIASGLIAAGKRPGNRLGLLMVAYGFAVLIRPWQYSSDDVVFTIGYALGQLNVALAGHVVLAYPRGRVGDPLELWLVRAGYLATTLIPLATLLVYDGDAGLAYVPPGPESLLLAATSDRAAAGLEDAFVLLVYGLLAACFLALVARKLVRATTRERRLLAPLVLAAFVVATRALTEMLLAFVSPPPAIVERLYWWQVAGQLLLPVALLVGLLRSHLTQSHVGELVLELGQVGPEGIRDALARHLGDPSLELAFWLPDRNVYVDARGEPVELPRDDPQRSVTELRHGDEPIAAIVHDPSLDDEPTLAAAGAAARLALENARLHAEVLAQLQQVQESRARIVTAGDDQRRRIERDIHDGAQQRLVALALQLRAEQRRRGGTIDPQLEAVLTDAVDELQLAVSELRELARGVHPAVLTEEGLGGALESLAGRTPLRVTVEAAPAERFPAEVEAAAYYVACEALANAVKHAAASQVRIRAAREDGTLVIRVADDGVGGATLTGGTGLRGLADRVEAYGGRLRVESSPGSGTVVIGEIPCAS
jgi:signal transduction histidine kinase